MSPKKGYTATPYMLLVLDDKYLQYLSIYPRHLEKTLDEYQGNTYISYRDSLLVSDYPYDVVALSVIDKTTGTKQFCRNYILTNYKECFDTVEKLK